ncbi:MAG: hypothetical protein J6B96_06745 [Agathobacter sp.]|nr:hypothetical protein [Agathobacter sp.]
MRLHKCKKLLKFLVEEKLIDNRQIWCYAQMKAMIKTQAEPVTLYGLTLVCINQDDFFLYNAEYNSTNVELFYSCKLAEMKGIRIKKNLLSATLSFSKGDESFKLEMDDWKRFSALFEV